MHCDINASVVSLVSISKVATVHRQSNYANLVCCDNLNRTCIDYTYCSSGQGHKSFIDHVFITA